MIGKIGRALGIITTLILPVSVGAFVVLPLSCTSGGDTTSLPPSRSVSGLVEKLTLDDLATRADLVLLGEAVDAASHKEANGNIYTSVTFSVEQTFKGDTTNEVVVSTSGGKLDGEMMEVEDAPKFQLGESAIVFLEEGNGIYHVVGGFQGKFTIDKNNMVGNVPLQEFVEQVRNAVAKQ